MDGKLYAVGGRDGSSCLSSVEVYDPHTDKWTVAAPMLKRRGGEFVHHLVSSACGLSFVRVYQGKMLGLHKVTETRKRNVHINFNK